MIEKRITAKIDGVIKTGSLEEEQIQEIHKLEVMFPEAPKAPEIQTPEEKPEEKKE
jgi:hypothetical protein